MHICCRAASSYYKYKIISVVIANNGTETSGRRNNTHTRFTFGSEIAYGDNNVERFHDILTLKMQEDGTQCRGRKLNCCVLEI